MALEIFLVVGCWLMGCLPFRRWIAWMWSPPDEIWVIEEEPTISEILRHQGPEAALTAIGADLLRGWVGVFWLLKMDGSPVLVVLAGLAVFLGRTGRGNGLVGLGVLWAVAPQCANTLAVVWLAARLVIGGELPGLLVAAGFLPALIWTECRSLEMLLLGLVMALIQIGTELNFSDRGSPFSNLTNILVEEVIKKG